MKVIQALLLSFIIICMHTACEGDSDDGASESPNNTPSATILKGTVSYNGKYSGENTVVYVRIYTTNPKAVGTPEYSVSLNEPGTYEIDLGPYSGDLYISAFMDVDLSGSESGLTASSTLTDGVYSDPAGCYGDYAFINGGPTKVSTDNLSESYDIVIEDTGVIKFTLADAGNCTIGVITSSSKSDEMIHHMHVDVPSGGNTYYLPVPERDGWYLKLKYDSATSAEVAPGPAGVVKNQITEISF